MIGLLLVTVNVLVSGAYYPQDKAEGTGSQKPEYPEIQINARVPNGTPLDLVKPDYPPERDSHVAGSVVVEVKINEAGDVVSARTISGHPLLASFAVDAARKSKFKVNTDLGSRLITGTITYTFTDLRTLVGRRVTLRGKFSMRGKIGPLVIVSGQPIYLVSSPPSAWGKRYTLMEGKRVRVTGTLRFYQAPPLPEHSQAEAEARLPDYFYFDANRTIVRLDDRR